MTLNFNLYCPLPAVTTPLCQIPHYFKRQEYPLRPLLNIRLSELMSLVSWEIVASINQDRVSIRITSAWLLGSENNYHHFSQAQPTFLTYMYSSVQAQSLA